MQHRITPCDSRESPPANCSLPRPEIKKACNRSTAVGRENRFKIRPLCILNGRLFIERPTLSGLSCLCKTRREREKVAHLKGKTGPTYLHRESIFGATLSAACMERKAQRRRSAGSKCRRLRPSALRAPKRNVEGHSQRASFIAGLGRHRSGCSIGRPIEEALTNAGGETAPRL